MNARPRPRPQEPASAPLFSTTPARLVDLMPRDHARLDAMLASILELIHVDLRPRLDEHWTVFEEGLLAHLDAEEMFVLPELALHDAKRVDEIRAEHATIRELLARVGVGLELHIVREEQMQNLATFLRKHAEAEQADFYKWADKKVPQDTLKALVRRLRATWERSWGASKAAAPTGR